MRLKIWLAAVVGVSVPTVVLWFAPRLAQPLWYHDFADQRCLLCVPHALNVLSNAPFVLAGAWGVGYLLWARELPGFRNPAERWPYVAFFLLIALTGFGSAYYHSLPNNDRLMWDRLPLAMAFMALLAIIIAERIDRRAGMLLLVPLTLLGAGSVIYWHVTEGLDRGDLRPYLLVQFGSIAALPFILAMFPPRYTGSADLVAALGWYVGAKVLEVLDKPIYSLGHLVSGHTLKHLAAAVSGFLILHMIAHRRPLQLETAPRAENAQGVA